MSLSVVLKSIFDDKGIRQAQRAFSRLGSTVGKLGATLGVALSFQAISRSLGTATKSAVEDAKSQELLANQLRNTVGANTLVIQSVEAGIRAMQLSAAVADDELRPAFAQLVRATGDTEQSLSLLQLALDVSAGTGRDLGAVTIALSKAYQGNTTALSRLGIKAQEGVNIFDQLETQFSGAAQAAASADPYQRLNVLFGEISETVGSQLVPILNDQLVPVVEDFLEYLQSDQGADALDAFGESASALADGLLTLTVAFGNLGTAVVNFSKDSLILSTLFEGFSYWGAIFSGDTAKQEQIIRNQQQRVENYVKNGTARLSKYISGEANRFKNLQNKAIPSLVPDDPDPKGPKATQNQFQKVQKIIKDYQGKLLKAEQAYSKAKLDINKQYLEERSQLETQYAKDSEDIITESIDRLRNAFKSATQVGLGDLFGTETVNEVTTQVKKLTDRLTVTVATESQRTIGGTVESLISSLADKLAASKALVQSASDLASKGFSQTFIEQVVETGTDTGNALAKAILTASPEQQAALKQNFLELETVSDTGVDALAKSLNDGLTLATRELTKKLKDTQALFNEEMLALDKKLAQDLANAGYQFSESISGIQTEFEDVIDSLDGKFAGLGKTIDQLLAKMKLLQGGAVTDVQAALIGPGGSLEGAKLTEDVKVVKNAVNAAGIVIDSAADVAGSMAYIQARIDAANRYIASSSSNAAQEASARASITGFQSELANLRTASKSEGGAAGTVININVKTDTTQSAAMVGKTIGNVVTKYTTTGGKVLVSGQQ